MVRLQLSIMWNCFEHLTRMVLPLGDGFGGVEVNYTGHQVEGASALVDMIVGYPRMRLISFVIEAIINF